MKNPELQNELTIAEIGKLIAETESIEVETEGKRLINQERQLGLLAKKLNLVMQAQHSLQSGRMEDFLRLLNDLSDPTKMLTDRRA